MLADLDYAGDIAVISTNFLAWKSPLNALSKYPPHIRLFLNAQKCKLTVTRGSPCPERPLKVNAEEVQTEQIFCYLGTTLKVILNSDPQS